MMELKTTVETDKPAFRMDYTTKTLMLGSCFVENIGAKLAYFGFQTDINPCGIVYNPMSVAETLELLLDDRRFGRDDLRQNAGKWVSLSHHGRFSDADPEKCLQNINTRLERSAAYLRQCDVLVVTWGTAWVYRHRASGRIVSNCHKFPATDFERFRLTVEEIEEVYVALIRRLQECRPSLQILFTVSPVRHWKDGAHGNSLSKAVLLLAVDRLRKRFGQVAYFPAYEIMMDELRDYRFYADDMLHVSPVGIEYIWEKFRDLYLREDTRPWMERIAKCRKILQHRPDDPQAGAYLELRKKTLDELHRIEEQLGIGER